MGKVEAGVRRVAAWALVTGAAVGAVGTLAGCMEVGPAVAPVGAGGPTVGLGGDVGTSQDGAGGHHATVRRHPGGGPDAAASPSAGESAARPSAGATAPVPLPISVTPPANSPSQAAPTTPPAQPSPEPSRRPSPSGSTVTSPPPSPTPTVASPSGSPSAH